jgi:adenosylcobinamide kinase/adenosylcobinamide-phosphate guanylyltransferase
LKILYYGGQKSGKSHLAEQKALSLSEIVHYVATYDNSYNDSEMQSRIDSHQDRRCEKFVTIEEPLNLHSLRPNKTYLIDCMSMWIMNMMMAKKSQEILTKAKEILSIDANIIFVQNDVGSGVIPMESFSREYVDISGLLSQELAKGCDEVYHVVCGLERRLK